MLPGDRTIGRIAERTSGKANRSSKRASAAALAADRGVPAVFASARSLIALHDVPFAEPGRGPATGSTVTPAGRASRPCTRRP